MRGRVPASAGSTNTPKSGVGEQSQPVISVGPVDRWKSQTIQDHLRSSSTCMTGRSQSFPAAGSVRNFNRLVMILACVTGFIASELLEAG